MPSATASSTAGAARCRCKQPSTPRLARCFGKTAERHTSAEFVAFLTDIVTHQPKGKEIHVIAENLSRRTPTYSSWLNQVELWFGKNKQPKPVK